MKYIVNTKPLSDSLNLGVVNSNINDYFQKSLIAQITASSEFLRINLEADLITSEIRLKGKFDGDGTETRLVSAAMLKQLVSTFESNVTEIEFIEGGIKLYSGKSNFTLSEIIGNNYFELNRPTRYNNPSTNEIEIKKADWKFVKDYQMYALAMSWARPVYTRVWIGEAGDVIVGDMDNSIFTHSVKSNIGVTCLFKDTIINLFNSLPEGAKLRVEDGHYTVSVETDGYSFLTEFTPEYESNPDIGEYSSDIILGMMDRPESSLTVSTSQLKKILSQATLLSTGKDDIIEMSLANNILTLKNKNVKGDISTKGSIKNFTITFKTEMLKSVLGNYNDETIHLVNSTNEDTDETVGILVWSDDLTTIVAGVE